MEQVVVKDSDLKFYSQVTKDEWLQILSDENFMSNNYNFALSIFFLEPDYKSTCKYLAKKYFMSTSSLSGFITQFSKSVQKKLSKSEVLREDGSKSYWGITMTGRNVSGGLFEWQLRPELVEAMKELDFINANQVAIEDIGTLVEHINDDLGEFTKTFAISRKNLARMKKSPIASKLFKYEDSNRCWAINSGAGTEVQLHIYLVGNEIGYGLGFNTLYVRFKDDKTPIEYIKPFMDAFIAVREDEEISALNSRGYRLNKDYSDFINPIEDEHYLYGRILEMNSNKLSLIDYYSIINDLKGDLFNAYKKVFETAYEFGLTKKVSNKEINMEAENPLVIEICELLKTNKNIILTGAPGTGKTYLAKKVVEAIDADFELVQFHPSYDYTDFVEGLRPTQSENGEVGFELRDGVFKSFCKKALKPINASNFDEVYERFIDDLSENSLAFVTPVQKKPFKVEVTNHRNCKATPMYEKASSMSVTRDHIQIYFETGKVNGWKPYLVPICDYIKNNYDLKLATTLDRDKKFIIILDEINRAEVSKVFGELFFSIDPGYRGEQGKVKTQYANLQTDEDVFKDGFYIPENVYIIGTMNDIDRSVESFDFAMRRRFAWREIKAEDRLSMWEGEIDDWIDEARMRLYSLNKAIESIQGLNSSYHVGPAYFLKLANYEGDFKALWIHHLQSLLFEYLRGYPDADEQLENLKNAYDRVDSDDVSND